MLEKKHVSKNLYEKPRDCHNGTDYLRDLEVLVYLVVNDWAAAKFRFLFISLYFCKSWHYDFNTE